MYIADTKNQRIRKITAATSIITTIAGTGGANYGGDNGAATSATMNYPTGVAVDSAGREQIRPHLLTCYSDIVYIGNVYIVDRGNYRIRKVAVSTGIITTIAGSGGSGTYSGDGGAATAAKLQYPWGLDVDAVGSNLAIIAVTRYINYTLCRQRVHR